MKKRLDALTRIGRFQALMHDLGRSRLHSLERQQAGLTDDLKAVFETLESEGLAYGPQAGLAARHIRALQCKLDQLHRDQEAARLSALAQGTRAKLAAITLETAVLDHRRHIERRELAELIERTIARRGKLDIRLKRDAGSSLAPHGGVHGFQSPYRCRHGGPQRG